MRQHVLFCLVVFALYLCVAAAISFSATVSSEVAGSPTVAVGDPVQWILQGGGFALAVYIVRWLTTSMSDTLKTLGENMNGNTKALESLQELVRDLGRRA